MSYAALELNIPYDRNWDSRAYMWRRHQDRFKIAEYSNRMDSMRLSVTQSSLELPSKQIHFFMCHDMLLAQRSVSTGKDKLKFSELQ